MGLVAAAIVFLCGFLIDIFYIGWLHYADKGYHHRAALMSVFINACGLIAVLYIVEGSKLLIVADMVGLYLGTMVGVRWKEKRNGKQDSHSQ